VFINYRGVDSQTAAALIDQHLTAYFGRDDIFLDSRSILVGSDFADELLGRLRLCSVLLVVIGPYWLTLTDKAGRRRIDDPADWIRRELVEAFTHELRIVPVLTDGATLPAGTDLPDDIAGLSRRQYVSLRRRYYEPDLAYLVKRIVEAEPDLAKVAQRHQARAATALADAVTEQVCPYRGLEAFGAEHAGLFYGRTAAVQHVLAALAGPRRALLLLGPSGAGKSSLVQAGVLPGLAAGALPGSDRWIPVLARPGQDLLAELDRAGLPTADHDIAAAVEQRLAGQPIGSRVLLVIDQFEELLTPLATDAQAATQRGVIDQIATAIDSPATLSVVLVMRDDFYSRLAGLAPELLQILAPGLVNVPATLDQRDLQDIITKPATAAGLRCQDGLTERIITEVLAVDPHASARHAPVTVLPLLELTLQQLWQRRDDGWLTHEAYQRIGGVAGSLTTWCDTAIGHLPTTQRTVAQRILTALVRPADQTYQIPAVRQQLPLTVLRDLAEDDERTREGQLPGRGFDEVLTVLSGHRIVTTRTGAQPETTPVVPVAELVHDALIRDWGTLRDWVNQDHRFQDWLRRAREQHTRWADRHDPDDLLHGTDLAEGEDWSKQHRPLPRDIAALLSASRERQQARARRTRRLNTVLASLLVAVMVAAVIAGWQAVTARIAEHEAQRQQLTATVQALVVQANAERLTQPRLSAQLSIAAMRLDPGSSDARASLLAALTQNPLTATVTAAADVVRAVAWTRDGTRLAAGSQDHTVSVWDMGNPAHPVRMTVLKDAGDWIDTVAWNGDGTRLAGGGRDGRLLIWDLRDPTHPALEAGLPGPGEVHAVAWSPDGNRIAAGGEDGTILVWDAHDRSDRSSRPR